MTPRHENNKYDIPRNVILVCTMCSGIFEHPVLLIIHKDLLDIFLHVLTHFDIVSRPKAITTGAL